jgi:organic hydroperoxide reductase OsmC/OhrA
VSGHQYHASVHWERGAAIFTDNRYSRGHTWGFDAGLTVPASSSPHVVRVPYSVEAAVDPEEALVAAISSCHMLWFLSLAAGAGLCVDDYRDDAVGVMGKNAAGKVALLSVKLRPRIAFSGAKRPSAAQIDSLHHRAHEECFIANSVTAEITVEAAVDV